MIEMKMIYIAYDNGDIIPSAEERPICAQLFITKEQFDRVMDNPQLVYKEFPDEVEFVKERFENLLNEIIKDEEENELYYKLYNYAKYKQWK